ncbi:DNA-binding protein [Pseudomonas aeruginosa]|uniref:DNA-binding protein n=1 Tax=Pseudomonas aeruginosa TaxID=287 RepID=UPI0008FAFEA0|nr:DNA-binding protein [Pseudomonas aeruginosa]
MIRERIIAIWEYKKLTAKKLEELSGIDREKWYALRKGGRRANEDDITSMVAIHPEYALWLVSGNIAPESGQTSPAYDEAQRNLPDQSTG